MSRAIPISAALQLRLYVAGMAPNSKRALANVHSLCETHFASRYSLEVVDLLLHPTRALADRIIVTPTLLRLLPRPGGRLIGDLSDAAQVLLILGGR